MFEPVTRLKSMFQKLQCMNGRKDCCQGHLTSIYNILKMNGQTSLADILQKKKQLSGLYSAPELRNRRGGCDHISHLVR